MSNRNEPAFPIFNSEGATSLFDYNTEGTGLSMRDYFAAKAIQALLPIHISNGCEDFSFTAEAAYSAADAMMEAREK